MNICNKYRVLVDNTTHYIYYQLISASSIYYWTFISFDITRNYQLVYVEITKSSLNPYKILVLVLYETNQRRVSTKLLRSNPIADFL